MRLARIWIVTLIGSLAGLGGCASVPTNERLTNPAMHLTFSSVSPDEKSKVESVFATQGTRSLRQNELDGADFGFEVPLDLGPSFSLDDLFARIRQFHALVCGIKSDAQAQILRNKRVFIRFGYVSTNARADSDATILFVVEPPAAELRVDVPDRELPDIDAQRSVPGLEGIVSKNRSSKPQGENNQLEIHVPFAFIKSHDFIYFRTTYQGNKRYFEYDLTQQHQHEVAGVGTVEGDEADWAFYKAKRRLPEK